MANCIAWRGASLALRRTNRAATVRKRRMIPRSLMVAARIHNQMGRGSDSKHGPVHHVPLPARSARYASGLSTEMKGRFR